MDSFATTIFPYSKESFFSTFWEKKYCHISSDQNPDLLNFLNTLFSYDEADRILTTERNRIHESIRVSKDGLTIPQENLYNNEGCGIVNYDIRKILNIERVNYIDHSERYFLAYVKNK